MEEIFYLCNSNDARKKLHLTPSKNMRALTIHLTRTNKKTEGIAVFDTRAEVYNYEIVYALSD